MSDDDTRDYCDLCGTNLVGKGWLLLNRYGIGSGKAHCLSEGRVDGEYQWNPDEMLASGHLLCLPCVPLWIGAKQAEVDQRTAGTADPPPMAT